MNKEELENTKLNLNCPICNKSLYINGELAHTKKGVYHLECYLISKKIFTTSMNRKVCYDEGFQKGKLEEKKEELRFLNDFGISSFLKYEEDIKKLNNRIKQLQKEIGGNEK